MAERCTSCKAFKLPGAECRVCALRWQAGNPTGAGRNREPGTSRRSMQKARHAVISRLRAAETDEERARLHSLLASHDERLAAAGGNRPSPRRKFCPACSSHVELNAENWPRRTDCKAWGRVCRKCVAGARPTPKAASPDVPRAKPGPKESAEAREDRLARERAREILTLIRRYEAVRFEPGRDRDNAYNRLALALRQHGKPVSDGERQWTWDEGLGEITSRKLRRIWRDPEDPHANPKRIARGGHMRSLEDMEVESIIDTLA